MAQVVLLMAFQANQVGLNTLSRNGPLPSGMVGMRQTAAVGCQPVRQPVIRLMQRKRQTLRMRDFDA
jgi:hypothetical protein